MPTQVCVLCKMPCQQPCCAATEKLVVHYCNVTQHVAAFPSALLLLRHLHRSTVWVWTLMHLKPSTWGTCPLSSRPIRSWELWSRAQRATATSSLVSLAQVSCWRGCTP